MKRIAVFGGSGFIIIKRMYVCCENQEIDQSYSQPKMWLLDSWLGKIKGQTTIWSTPRDILIKSGHWDENLTIDEDGDFFL